MMSLASAGVLKGKRGRAETGRGRVLWRYSREFLGELLLICAKGALLGIAVAAVLVIMPTNSWEIFSSV